MPGKLSALNLDHSKMAAASMAGNMASGKLAGKWQHGFRQGSFCQYGWQHSFR